LAAGSGRARLAADGSFTVKIRRRSSNRGLRRTERVEVRGRFTEGGAASGTVSGTVTLRRRERSPRRCGFGPLPLDLRRSDLGIGLQPAAPQPGAGYFGLTGQRSSGFMHPVVLVISPDGARIETLVTSFTKHCDPARVRVGGRTTGPIPLRADGRFSLRDRYTERYVDATERTVLRISGRFVDGGVFGKIRARSVARTPRGRVIDRCQVAINSFQARP
jgi:hypothetical protein